LREVKREQEKTRRRV
jgi:hypothetical protein